MDLAHHEQSVTTTKATARKPHKRPQKQPHQSHTRDHKSNLTNHTRDHKSNHIRATQKTIASTVPAPHKRTIQKLDLRPQKQTTQKTQDPYGCSCCSHWAAQVCSWAAPGLLLLCSCAGLLLCFYSWMNYWALGIPWANLGHTYLARIPVQGKSVSRARIFQAPSHPKRFPDKFMDPGHTLGIPWAYPSGYRCNIEVKGGH